MVTVEETVKLPRSHDWTESRSGEVVGYDSRRGNTVK